MAESFFFVCFVFLKDSLWVRLLQPCSAAIWLLHQLVHQSVLQYRLAAGLGQRVSDPAPPICSFICYKHVGHRQHESASSFISSSAERMMIPALVFLLLVICTNYSMMFFIGRGLHIYGAWLHKNHRADLWLIYVLVSLTTISVCIMGHR